MIVILSTGTVEQHGGTINGKILIRGGPTGGELIKSSGNLIGGGIQVDRGTASFGGGDTQVSVLSVGSMGLVNYTGGTLRANSISLANPMLLSSGGDKVVQTGAITITGPGKLDLADNDMVVDYAETAPSPLASIRTLIATGYNGGAWNGNGIASSSAASTAGVGLGYGSNSELGYMSFEGIPIDASTVLVKYTYLGDANLDGQVDMSDLANLATHWQTSGVWTDGDFDYDGFIDITDLGKLATNWQAGVGDPLGPGSLSEALASLGLPAVSVPEPAGAGVLLTAIALARILLRRRSQPA